MNFCSKCGTKLNDENKCTNCDVSVESKVIKKRNKVANITSIFFALISLILLIITLGFLWILFNKIIQARNILEILSYVKFFVPAFFPFFAPFSIGSFIFSLKSYKLKKNILAIISFCVNLIPFLLSVYVVLFWIVASIMSIF